MTNEYRSAGKTTVTPDVLLTIARQSALEIEGVHSMAPVRVAVKDLLDHRSDGVSVRIEDSQVFVDLFLVLESEVNIREVSRTVQAAVARAIAEMTGLHAGHINVHIEDIFYKTEA
jgi:uncharacterized alkaline shock family protein YloU